MIIPFLVGNPYKPLFAIVTGRVVDPMYKSQFTSLIGGTDHPGHAFSSALGTFKATAVDRERNYI